MQINIYTPNFNNFNNILKNKLSLNNSFTANPYNLNDLALNETIGRSVVNFTGKKDNFELCEDDKKFIDAAASNLRLEKEEKLKLKNIITSFLAENNYKTLDDLDQEKNNNTLLIDSQVDLFNSVCDKMDFSDWDAHIFSADLIQRIYYYMQSEEYVPEKRKYDKDLEVVDDIFDKYGFDEMQRADIFDVMKLEAETNDFDTLFDIFKPENASNYSITKKYLNETFGFDTSLNLMIDCGCAATKDEKTRHSNVNKTKMSDKFYKDCTNKDIFDEMAEQFGIDEDLQDDIIEKISERFSENKNIYQIAFEIADEYNLPAGAEKTITDIILNTDNLNNLLEEYHRK